MKSILIRHKFIFVTGVLALGLAISWLVLPRRDIKKKGCEKITGDNEEKVIVRIFKVKNIPFSDYLEVMGTVKGNNEIELRFPVTGTLRKINFKQGDWVEKGEVIAELDLKEAELHLEKAKIALENTEKLYKLGAALKGKYEEARIDLNLAEEGLKRHLLMSHFRGILGEIEKEAGELVTPQDKIASFIEASSVNVEVGIIEKEIRKIKTGQVAEIRVDTYPEKIFEGKVSNIVPVVSGSNRTMRALIMVGNPRGELLPGMFARVRILIYDKNNALLVPANSVFREGNKFFVFKIAGMKVKKSEVIINYLNDEYAEVKDGVSEGDAVAIKVMGEMGEGKAAEIIE